MLGPLIKYSLFGLTAWLLIGNARPAYVEAYKAQKAADLASRKVNDSSSRRDAEQAFKQELEAQGCKAALDNIAIEATKDNGKWILSGEFTLLRPIYKDITMSYDFSVASDRKSLWQ